jgi:hypothetical protein
MNRRERRRTGRNVRHSTPVHARHGRACFVFDITRRRIVKSIDDMQPFDPFEVVWPHLDKATFGLSFMPGMVDPDHMFGWASDVVDKFPTVEQLDSRMLVTGVCPHVRESEVERLVAAGIDTANGMLGVFDRHPEHWFVYALLPAHPTTVEVAG